MTISAKAIGKPAWLWIVAALGSTWNIFGAFQFLASLGQSEGGLMMEGMTAQQAAAYSALPLWMTAAFAIGVFGGIAGSLALWLRHKISVPIFALSLLAYVALWAGDYAHGLFDILPQQMAILNMVVAIAGACLSRPSRRVERHCFAKFGNRAPAPFAR